LPTADSFAQAPAAPPPSAAADQHADLAKTAYRAGNYEAALQRYEMAYRADQRPVFLYNMGRCLERLERYGEAIDRFRGYLDRYRQVNNGQHASNRTDVLNLIRALRVREYHQRPAVVISSNPPGATVTLINTGRPLGTTPLTTHLEPGIYKVRLKRAGHVPLDADLTVRPGKTMRAVFRLRRVTERAAISLWCNVKRAKVIIDGKVRAMTPFSGRLEIRPGRHSLTLRRPGYHPIEEIVEVPRDHVLHVDYVLQPEGAKATWRSWTGWPLLVVGMGGIGGGAAAAAAADDYYADSRQFSDYQAWQYGGYIGGAVLFSAGAALLGWDLFRDAVDPTDRVQGRIRPTGKRLRPLDAGAP